MTARLASSMLGLLFLVVGCGTLGADWYEHHTWHPLHAGVGVGFALLGALIVDPTHVKPALGSVVDAAKALMPWNWGKSGSPPQGGGA